MSAWTRSHVAALRPEAVGRLPVIVETDVVAVVEGIDIWDSWPVRTRDGSVADVCGHAVWVALAAPASGDPGMRHDIAHHRAFLVNDDGTYTDLGPLFQDGQALGTRQWAGATVVDDDQVCAYYTAVGTPGAAVPGFRQRLAVAKGTVKCHGGLPEFSQWTDHVELFEPDTHWYDTVDATHGEPGFIKAMRDPFPILDPASGVEYLLFTASLAPSLSTDDFNGAIGVARRTGEDVRDWELLEPLLTADTVNNELERPHVVVVDNRYYVFFSTQRRTFHPDIEAPTGLYGFVADSILGPYEPLNGHGLVMMNPPERPGQVYSWLVLNDLSVVGFIDGYGVGADGELLSDLGGDERSRRFGGTFSPLVSIAVDGANAELIAQAVD